MVSSLEDHLGWKWDEPSWRMEELGLTDIWPPRIKTPRRGMRDTSTERGLTKVRKPISRPWLPQLPWRKR